MRTGSCKRIPGRAWASHYQERQRRERPLPTATPTPTPTTTAGEGLGSILSPQVPFSFCQIHSFYTANNYLYHTGPLPEMRCCHVTTRLPPDDHEAPPKERGQQHQTTTEWGHNDDEGGQNETTTRGEGAGRYPPAR
jgi:hypothetical protein